MKSYENVKRNKRKLKRKISAALTKTSDKRFLFAKTKKKDWSISWRRDTCHLSDLSKCVSEWLQLLIDWERKEEKGDEDSIAQGLLQSFEMTAKREQDLLYTCNTGHVQEKKRRREEEKKRRREEEKNKEKEKGKKFGKMKGAVQLKWRENMSVKDEMNNGEKREEKGNWCHHEHWGRKKGENGQPALDAKSQIRRELLYSFYQFSIFNFQFQPRFLLLVCFLFTINTAMNTMNQCTFHISRFLSFSRRIHVEWILSKHRVEVKNVLRGKGNNMVRLIINKEILTQQYIFFVVNLKPLYQRTWRGK